MPFTLHSVSGFDDLKLLLRQLEDRLRVQSMPGRAPASHIVFVYFTGSKLSDGLDWCEECARADPIVRAALDRLEPTLGDSAETAPVHWVQCQVGARDFWYNPNNPFRRDPQLRLDQLPALLGLYRKGGDWADESADLSQIYDKEEFFATPKAVEGTILDFVDLSARFGR